MAIVANTSGTTGIERAVLGCKVPIGRVQSWEKGVTIGVVDSSIATEGCTGMPLAVSVLGIVAYRSLAVRPPSVGCNSYGVLDVGDATGCYLPVKADVRRSIHS